MDNISQFKNEIHNLKQLRIPYNSHFLNKM